LACLPERKVALDAVIECANEAVSSWRHYHGKDHAHWDPVVAAADDGLKVLGVAHLGSSD
jgi:hypothetical protein